VGFTVAKSIRWVQQLQLVQPDLTRIIPDCVQQTNASTQTNIESFQENDRSDSALRKSSNSLEAKCLLKINGSVMQSIKKYFRCASFATVFEFSIVESLLFYLLIFFGGSQRTSRGYIGNN
jgi:hypothetical protein